MKTCVYPGTFDPITMGHLDIVQRTATVFDRVIVAVSVSKAKRPLFSLEERVEMIRNAVAEIPNVEVDSFEGLLVEYVKEKQAAFIIRGLRAISDFEYEFQMASMNRRMHNELETVCFMTRTDYSFLSSSMVKEIGSLGGNIQGLVPAQNLDAVLRVLRPEKMGDDV